MVRTSKALPPLTSYGGTLERMLKEPERRRRWPWVVGMVASVATWYLWPPHRADRTKKEASSYLEREADRY